MSGNNIYNIYCDESCHLENDQQNVMVLGAIWCPLSRTKDISDNLRKIKIKHGLSEKFELKWIKVSPAKIAYYLDVVDCFFSESDLHFRSIIILNKNKLRHDDFSQDHNTWYYKMFFHLLDAIFQPQGFLYRIYLDVKDTCSSNKIQKLHQILCNKNYDFSRDIIARVQSVRSNEVEILQVVDLFIGALA